MPRGESGGARVQRRGGLEGACRAGRGDEGRRPDGEYESLRVAHLRHLSKRLTPDLGSAGSDAGRTRDSRRDAAPALAGVLVRLRIQLRLAQLPPPVRKLWRHIDECEARHSVERRRQGQVVRPIMKRCRHGRRARLVAHEQQGLLRGHNHALNGVCRHH